MQPAAALCLLFVIITISSLITVGCVAIIALGSSGVFTTSKASAAATTTISNVTATPNTTTISNITATSNTTTILSTTTSSLVSVSSLNDVSLYPNGSYLANLSSFTSAPSTLALTPISQSIFDSIGGVDNSSTIIEAGRPQYLYFHLPNGTSNASSGLMSIPAVKRDVDHADSARLTIGSNFVTGVAIYFGSIGSNDFVIIIPIVGVSNTTNQVLPGIFFYYLADGSVIIRIEISIPASLCPSSNGQPIDACLSISYQAYTVVNYNQITSALLVDIQMACGDVCSLPAGSCSASCTTCDGQQVAGYDTPVTRRYEMGSPVGSFQFYYNTYVIQDRITVWNGGMIIFDTGCVGASDTVQINYSSNSSYIRVDVEPNCACTLPNGCGTVWVFTVSCLNSTSSSRDIMNSNKIAGENTIKLSLSDKLNIESRLHANRNKLLKK